MNKKTVIILKLLRKLYAKAYGVKSSPKLDCHQDPNTVSKIIYDKLVNEEPCMIARFGAFELNTMVNYLGVKQHNKNIWQYIKGKSLPWWWDKSLMNYMQTNAGFFPSTKEKIEKFCELMIEDIEELDVLGSWLVDERYFINKIQKVDMVQREIQNPYFASNPWTKALENKKVLVVHPFASLILKQYQEKRDKLFNNPAILPDFELKVVKAVQSVGGADICHNDWFEALDWMKEKIDKQHYDVCLIGCGAYGFPLAAHVKRKGKKSVHLGGSLQLLFGIKGKRWEDPNYNEKYNYYKLINNYWVRPGENLMPKNANQIEGGCYW